MVEWCSRERAFIVCATAGVALAFAACQAPARAYTQLNTGPNGSYRVKVMSWSEIPFRSVVRQQYDLSCGSAAVATLLSYHYDHDTQEQPVFSAMWSAGDRALISRSGFSMLDIKSYLDGIGFRTEGFRLTLDDLKRLGRPGIVLLSRKGYKHFVVLKGVRGDILLVGDPKLGLMRYSSVELAAQWNGILLMVVKGPSDREPYFNVASDWMSQAQAPLGNRRVNAPIASITNYLPPLYQVTPQALSGVGAIAIK